MSSPDSLALRFDLPVLARPSGPGREGILGALAIDPDLGNLYALTSAQLVPPGSILVSAGDEILLSAAKARSGLDAKSVQPTANLVVAVPLLPFEIDIGQYWDGGQALAGRDFREPAVLTDLGGSVGATVRVGTRTCLESAAIVVATESRFAMPHPVSGEIVLFDSALELKAIGPEPLISAGDIGALVSSQNGDWLGVVVAGGHDFAFVAPLHSALRKFDLSPPKLAAVQQYNAALAYRAPDPIDEPPQLRSEEAIAARASAHRILEDA